MSVAVKKRAGSPTTHGCSVTRNEFTIVTADMESATEWAKAEYSPDEGMYCPSIDTVEELTNCLDYLRYRSGGQKLCVAPLPAEKEQIKLLKTVEDDLIGAFVLATQQLELVTDALRGRARIVRLMGTYVEEELFTKLLDPELDYWGRNDIYATYGNRSLGQLLRATGPYSLSLKPESVFLFAKIVGIMRDSRSTNEFLLRALWGLRGS